MTIAWFPALVRHTSGMLIGGLDDYDESEIHTLRGPTSLFATFWKVTKPDARRRLKSLGGVRIDRDYWEIRRPEKP